MKRFITIIIGIDTYVPRSGGTIAAERVEQRSTFARRARHTPRDAQRQKGGLITGWSERCLIS